MVVNLHGARRPRTPDQGSAMIVHLRGARRPRTPDQGNPRRFPWYPSGKECPLKKNVIGSCLVVDMRLSAYQRHKHQARPTQQPLFGIQGQRPGAGVQGAGGGPLQKPAKRAARGEWERAASAQ